MPNRKAPKPCNLSIVWQCKSCRGSVEQSSVDVIRCPTCGREWEIVERQPKGDKP